MQKKRGCEPGKDVESQRNLYVFTRDTRDTRDNQAGRGFHCPGLVPGSRLTRDSLGCCFAPLRFLILRKVGPVRRQVLPVELDGRQLIQPTQQPAIGARRDGLGKAGR